MLKKHKLGRYLVEVFGPDLVNFPYQKRRNLQDAPGLYEGEVVLHIAIVSKRLDEVEFLLENGADVQARAWGTFFAKGGTCYYGEFPLSFAVCMEQPEIIQALVDKGVDVDAQDSYGNTALHLAVIYSLPDMYELLADKHGADERIANNDGLSPLSLAASLNNTVMFDRILRYQRNMAWAYGPVTCFQTPLEDIDTVRIPGTEKDIRQQTRSVLKIICEKGNAELLKMPFINTVMEVGFSSTGRSSLETPRLSVCLSWPPVWRLMSQVKWQSFGKWIFFAHAALYAMLMITVSVLVAYQRQTDSGGFTVFGRAKKGTWYEDYQAAADDEKQLLGEELRLQKLHHETDSESQQTLETLEYAVLVLVALFAVLELYDLVKWIQEFVEESRWRRELRSETLKRCTHCMAEIRHPTRFNNDAADPATDGTAHLLGRTAKKAQPAEQRIQNWLEFWAQALAQRWQQSHPITFLLYAFIVLMVTHCFIWSYMSARPGWEPWPMYTVNVELSLAMICGWGYCLYFTSGFKNTGPLVVSGVCASLHWPSLLCLHFLARPSAKLRVCLSPCLRWLSRRR